MTFPNFPYYYTLTWRTYILWILFPGIFAQLPTDMYPNPEPSASDQRLIISLVALLPWQEFFLLPLHCKHNALSLTSPIPFDALSVVLPLVTVVAVLLLISFCLREFSAACARRSYFCDNQEHGNYSTPDVAVTQHTHNLGTLQYRQLHGLPTSPHFQGNGNTNEMPTFVIPTLLTENITIGSSHYPNNQDNTSDTQLLLIDNKYQLN